jgi:hypothetical protein
LHCYCTSIATGNHIATVATAIVIHCHFLIDDCPAAELLLLSIRGDTQIAIAKTVRTELVDVNGT